MLTLALLICFFPPPIQLSIKKQRKKSKSEYFLIEEKYLKERERGRERLNSASLVVLDLDLATGGRVKISPIFTYLI